MNPLISIVVPVFNIELYITKCIESLLHQTYGNYEILLIDDGSSDNSSFICKQYVKNYKKLKYFYKNNGGLSSARNYGIDVSSGELICFVDGDDYVSECYLQELYDLMFKTKSDISVCNFYYEFDNGHILRDKNKKVEVQILSSIDAIKNLYSFDSFGVGTRNKLFKKNLFLNKDNRFPEGKISEDYFIMYKVFFISSQIAYTLKPLYYYVQRPESITKSKKVAFDVVEAAFLFRQFVLKNKLENKLLNHANMNIIFSCLSIYNSGVMYNTSSLEDQKSLIDIIKNKEYKFDHSILPISRKIQLFLFNRCRFLYNFIFFYFKKRRVKKQGR